MLAVEPRGLDGADEELRTVGVGTSVSHRQNTGAGVLQGEVLVLELVAVDGLATSAIVVGEVTALELCKDGKILLSLKRGYFLITKLP